MTWHAEASCLGADANLFFPERGDVMAWREALAMCEDCPVKAQCLHDNAFEKDGIFGGLTGKQRRQWRKDNNVGRTCVQCGATFTPHAVVQVCCSEECKKARHIEQKAESAARAWWSEV